jgi:hypothetical protein
MVRYVGAIFVAAALLCGTASVATAENSTVATSEDCTADYFPYD